MPKQLAVVMIHGIGRQRPDYAARMIRNIEQQLVVQGYEPDAIAWQPVYWDDILAPAEKAYLERSLDTASLKHTDCANWWLRYWEMPPVIASCQPNEFLLMS